MFKKGEIFIKTYKELSEDNQSFVRRLFILSANNKVYDKEYIIKLSEIYEDLTDRDLKKDWISWCESIRNVTRT